MQNTPETIQKIQMYNVDNSLTSRYKITPNELTCSKDHSSLYCFVLIALITIVLQCAVFCRVTFIHIQAHIHMQTITILVIDIYKNS